CLQQGYDYRTAGHILGIPAGTVASRLSAARAVLRSCLRDEEAPR
ncbi:MAG: RNA polymerase subunit sigma, partial [Actinobacteria bacterium]|nr:RNA polymerase subunit sigma [Actinomycetota bacterium]